MQKTNYDRIGESVYRATLPGGLPLCVIPKEHHAKSYAFFATRYGGMDLRFQKDGVWRDTPAGIAHYLEHKMFDTREGNALQELAKNGAEPNAFTSNAITAYFFDSTEHFEENLKILLSFVSEPYFTPESVAKEQGIIGQEIRMIEDNPEWQVYTRMMQALYRTSAARISVAGTVESIAEITADTLYDCHRVFYTPSNMMLCVVGNVDPQRIMDIAYATLPKVSASRPIPRDYGADETGVVAARETSMEMEVSMPTFLAGYQCVPPVGGDAILKNSLVGDIACDLLLGDSSPLYTRLYDEGLINGSFGGCYEMMPGVAYLYAGGDSRDPAAVQKAITEEAARLVREGIDETYYAQLCKASYGETLRALNSFENIAVTLTEGYFRGFDAYRFPEVFDTITPADIVAFLRENIVESRSVLSTILPKADHQEGASI
ncbi:MAG: pitrilysin family protein [Oscillospiraceae bacterium]